MVHLPRGYCYILFHTKASHTLQFFLCRLGTEGHTEMRWGGEPSILFCRSLLAKRRKLHKTIRHHSATDLGDEGRPFFPLQNLALPNYLVCSSSMSHAVLFHFSRELCIMIIYPFVCLSSQNGDFVNVPFGYNLFATFRRPNFGITNTC